LSGQRLDQTPPSNAPYRSVLSLGCTLDRSSQFGTIATESWSRPSFVFAITPSSKITAPSMRL
jgi:hypothetical protein